MNLHQELLNLTESDSQELIIDQANELAGDIENHEGFIRTSRMSNVIEWNIDIYEIKNLLFNETDNQFTFEAIYKATGKNEPDKAFFFDLINGTAKITIFSDGTMELGSVTAIEDLSVDEILMA